MAKTMVEQRERIRELALRANAPEYIAVKSSEALGLLDDLKSAERELAEMKRQRDILLSTDRAKYEAELKQRAEVAEEMLNVLDEEYDALPEPIREEARARIAARRRSDGNRS